MINNIKFQQLLVKRSLLRLAADYLNLAEVYFLKSQIANAKGARQNAINYLELGGGRDAASADMLRLLDNLGKFIQIAESEEHSNYQTVSADEAQHALEDSLSTSDGLETPVIRSHGEDRQWILELLFPNEGKNLCFVTIEFRENDFPLYYLITEHYTGKTLLRPNFPETVKAVVDLQHQV